PLLVKCPNAGEGFVAIDELAASVENCHPGRHLVECAAMGGHLPLQLVLRDREGSYVEGRAAAATVTACGDRLITLDAAIDNGLKLHAPRLLALAQAEQLRPLPGLEQLDLLLQRLLI